MSDVDRVNEWFVAGRLVRPDTTTPSLVHLTRALASIAGADISVDEPTTQLADAIGSSEHVVFVLADGLGLNVVEARPADSVLRRGLEMPIRSVFPSSTAPALTSVATGMWPAEHALPAWHVYLPGPHRQITALPFVERFSDRASAQVGVSPESLFLRPTLISRYVRNYRAFLPRRIADSVYSRYVGGGSPAQPYDKLNDGIDAVVARVLEARRPSYTYLYYPNIDTAEHDHGPESTQTQLEVARLEAALRRLEKGLGGKARIVVSADHGQFLVQRSKKRFIGPDDDVMELLLTPPSGEGLIPIFHCQPGTQEDFADRFRSRYGDAFALLSVDEADSMRLFGPTALSSEARDRLGDFIGISPGGEVLIYEPDASVAKMKGFHGGLSPAEMLIPLIVL